MDQFVLYVRHVLGKTCLIYPLCMNGPIIFTAWSPRCLHNGPRDPKLIFTWNILLKFLFYLQLNIWDTAGLERTGSLTSHYYHSAHAVAFLYAVDDLSSLNIVLHWIEDAERYAPYAAKFLIANKIDLDKDDWEVEEGKAQMFMESNSIHIKYNVSAKTGEGIKEMFTDISRYLMQQNVAPTVLRGDPFHLSEEDPSLDLRKKRYSTCSC